MAKTDASPPLPYFPGGYTLTEISHEDLAKSVKPKQFIHIDQSECIMCEGCVDMCPWKCIHMLSVETVVDAVGVARPGADPDDHVVFVIDDEVCTRCGLCVDRCPTGVIIMGKTGVAPKDGDPHHRDNKHGYGYGMRL